MNLYIRATGFALLPGVAYQFTKIIPPKIISQFSIFLCENFRYNWLQMWFFFSLSLSLSLGFAYSLEWSIINSEILNHTFVRTYMYVQCMYTHHQTTCSHKSVLNSWLHPLKEFLLFLKGCFTQNFSCYLTTLVASYFSPRPVFERKTKQQKNLQNPLKKINEKKNKYRNKENYSLMNQNIKCRLHGDLCLLKDV